jgi:hypothetical protein
MNASRDANPLLFRSKRRKSGGAGLDSRQRLELFAIIPIPTPGANQPGSCPGDKSTRAQSLLLTSI